MTNPTILIVEDYPDTLQLLSTFFSLYGFNVSVATNGIEALHLADHGIDAVASDLAMSAMDGYELIRRMRETRGRRPIPIVAVTGQGIDPEKAAGLGCCRVVSKPCHLPELVQMLRFLVDACVHDCERCPNRLAP